MSKRRLIWLALAVIALVALLTWLLVSRQSSPVYKNPLNRLVSNASLTPTPTPDPLKPINFLLLGYAGKNHDGGNLSDSIMVVNVNPKTQIATLISLPRDLWVSLPLSPEATPSYKINHAWAVGNDDKTYSNKPSQFTGSQGGFNLAKYAVNEATGIMPDYVIAMDFAGFKNIINLIGPLKISVPYTFDDYFYPLTGAEKDPCGRTPEDIAALTATMSGEKLEREFLCRYEHLHFDKGDQVMDADTALKFVRSRHSEVGGGDFGRLTRQQALITAVKKQLINPAIIPKLGNLIDAVYKSVKTDVDVNFVKNALTNFGRPNQYVINSVTLNQKDLIQYGVSSDRQSILIPIQGEGNFSAIHQFVQSALTASASALPSPAP